MEKINLSVQRSFSDLITVTINFMKQEFVPFIRAFAVIGFPMILLMLFFMKDLLMGVFDMSLHPEAYYDVNNFGDTMLRTLFTSLIWGADDAVGAIALLFLICGFTGIIIKPGIEERITIIEVFRVMLRKFGVYLVWSVFCGLVVFIGFLFLFVPGIYIGISFTFGSYLLILRDNGLGKIISESMAMVKGNWWKTFGFILVMYLLVGVVAYLFGHSLYVRDDVVGFTGAIPNIYEITFSLLLS